ncbi:hypothetical protein [Inconstantimicrobium mannanitabidum]|uniref:Uncharacterized protein n=1 Tax=Inconstantimicrobium mannanitabidum TaxID=1604901 RepID=A0ACB5RIJ8_9CLOT|nr:hypothetical protein [Clostridium sp. TW13]GKX68956.1 hypothetical protein rsdtw13_42140 [Clostridium sp. TW13]
MKKFLKKLTTLLLVLTLPLTFIPKEAHASGEVIDGGMSVMGIVGNFLSTFFPLIAKSIDNLSINNGDYNEWISFAPPDFAQDKFYISMYDGINPNNSSLSYRIKIYSQTNAKNPVEVTLKSGQQYCVTADSNTPELYFEFFNGNETTPFERYCLPMEYHNKNFGIALGCNKKVYYLQKETNRVYNDQMMFKLFNVTFNSNFDRIYNGLSQENKEKYSPYIFRKTKAVSKKDMSPSNCVDNQSILNKIIYYQNYVPKPYFRETFENNALLAWDSFGNVGETLQKACEGGFSLYLSGDKAYIYKNLNATQFKTLTMFFYDDASVTSAKVMGTAFGSNFDSSDAFGSISIGVDTDASKNNYAFTVGRGGSWITSIPRSTGWHKLTWNCVSTTKTDIAIDDKFVYTACAYIDSVKSVALGDWWADGKDCAGKFFFDYVDVR